MMACKLKQIFVIKKDIKIVGKNMGTKKGIINMIYI